MWLCVYYCFSGTLGVVGHCCGYYGEGSGAIHIAQVTCSGSERSITSCTYFDNIQLVITSHTQDVGVECQQGESYTSMDIWSSYRRSFIFCTCTSIPHDCVPMFIASTKKILLKIKVADMLLPYIRRWHKGGRYPSGWWQLLMAWLCGDIFRWKLGYI